MFQFLASSAGRIVRVLLGLVLFAVGIYAVSGAWRWILMIIGLVPFAAGLFDFCVFSPLFGLPFIGERLREKKTERQIL